MKTKMKTEVFEGVLESYYETGYEGTNLLILYQDHLPNALIPNPNYDPQNPSQNYQFQKSLHFAEPLKKGDVVEILDGTNRKVRIGKGFEIIKQSKADGFNISVYPADMDLIEFKKLFVSEKIRARIIRESEYRVAYFGGSFDPIHSSHEDLIKKLCEMFDKVVVIPCHNWTKPSALFPLEERYAALKAVTAKYPKVEVPAWCLTEDTSSTLLVAQKIEEIEGTSPFIVIGSDNTENITKWKNWDKLQDYPFAIVPRAKAKLNLEPFKRPQILDFRVNLMSSTEIRQENRQDLIPEEAKAHLNLDLLKKSGI